MPFLKKNRLVGDALHERTAHAVAVNMTGESFRDCEGQQQVGRGVNVWACSGLYGSRIGDMVGIKRVIARTEAAESAADTHADDTDSEAAITADTCRGHTLGHCGVETSSASTKRVAAPCSRATAQPVVVGPSGGAASAKHTVWAPVLRRHILEILRDLEARGRDGASSRDMRPLMDDDLARLHDRRGRRDRADLKAVGMVSLEGGVYRLLPAGRDELAALERSGGGAFDGV